MTISGIERGKLVQGTAEHRNAASAQLRRNGTSANVRTLRWRTVIAPSKSDLQELERLGFPREDLVDALDPHERPRLRLNGGTVLVVLRVPSAERSPPLTTLPLGILIGPEEQGLIMCSKDLDVVQRVSTVLAQDGVVTQDALAEILEIIAKAYLDQLARIEEAVDRIEMRLERSLANREVLALLHHQKSLMHFNVALDEILVTLEHLEKVPVLRPAADDDAWLDDVVVEFRQASVVAQLSSRDLGQMMSAFSSIISNDLNVVMKFLASITVVLTWPLFLASLYGMNVPLPGQHSPAAAGIVLAMALAGCVILVVLLRRRQWL